MKEKETETKRLSIDIPAGLHYELRLFALKYNTTLSACVIQALIDILKKQKQYQKGKDGDEAMHDVS